jgi:hypothetical protein
VVAGARALALDRHPLLLYRRPGERLPVGVEPRRWELPVRRVGRIRPRSSRALTLSFDWGVTAAPERPGPLGRAGPWSEEAAAIERAYGTDRVLHVSLGEFARTLGSRRQVAERYREGGKPTRWIRTHLAGPRGRAEAATAHALYRRFRGFDEPRVLHLFPTFGRASSFSREFPEAVPTGPLWEEPFLAPKVQDRGEWVWYASPSSSTALLPAFHELGRALTGELRVHVRGFDPTDLPGGSAGPLRLSSLGFLARRAWRRRFATAELRIVTGGRSLLEAVQLGGPFLYFNGVTGTGPRRRRHRPEKLDALLGGWGTELRPELRRELGDFARARNAAAILRRAAGDAGWRRSFPARPPPPAYAAPYDEGGALLRSLALALASGEGAAALVARARARRLAPLSSSGARGSA